MFAVRFSKISLSLVKSNGLVVRNFVKVGDSININFMKDSKPTLVKEDKEYPDWLFTVGLPGPTKGALLDKFAKLGAEGMDKADRRRLKRLINAENIKANNAIASSEK